MTNKEAIETIKKHIEIHHLKEPRAIEITVALLKAVEALEKSEWHYPSKGELPELSDYADNIRVLSLYTGFSVVVNYNSINWLYNNKIIRDPDCWQYIKPPKWEEV